MVVDEDWTQAQFCDTPDRGLTLERAPNGGWLVIEGAAYKGVGAAGAYSSTADLLRALADYFPDEPQEAGA